MEKERKQSATCRSNQSDKARAKSCEYIRDYMRKKRAKVKATTLPPSPDEEEEVDATADPPPSSPGEQGDAETTAVDALMTMTKTRAMTTMVRGTQPLRSMQLWRRGAVRTTMTTTTSAAEAKQSSEQLKVAAEAKQSNERLKGVYFPKTVRELIMSNEHWTESTQPLENCRANEAMQVECNDGCQGREMCLNKRIQKCEVKRVRKEERGEKGFGLFADENIKKGEYVMEYTGEIVQNDPGNEYTMAYKRFNLWVDPSKSNKLAKFINQSCNPNCVNKMWAVKGMPRL